VLGGTLLCIATQQCIAQGTELQAEHHASYWVAVVRRLFAHAAHSCCSTMHTQLLHISTCCALVPYTMQQQWSK
jgi:hypothetical protein